MSVSLLHDAKHNLMRPSKWDRETHMDLFVCNEDCSWEVKKIGFVTVIVAENMWMEDCCMAAFCFNRAYALEGKIDSDRLAQCSLELHINLFGKQIPGQWSSSRV